MPEKEKRVPPSYEEMDAYRLSHDDLPDGAFFQCAEDLHGWTVDDWAWFSEEHAKRLERAHVSEGGDK